MLLGFKVLLTALLSSCRAVSGDKLDIKEGPQGLIIPDLRIEPVVRPEDVTNVLQKGKQNRSTLATNMNEHSSRSHLVLTLYVKGQDLAKGEVAELDPLALSCMISSTHH